MKQARQNYHLLSPFTQERKDGEKHNRTECWIESENAGERVEEEEEWRSHLSSKQVIEIHLTETRQKQKEGATEKQCSFALAWRRPVFVVCLCLSLSQCVIFSFPLCVHIETSILETGERESERGILVVCLSPPHHGAHETKQAGREHIHTFSLRRHGGEQLGSVLHWKPHFPFNQTDR